MNGFKSEIHESRLTRLGFVTLIVVSVLVAILLASALNGFTRVADSALADTAPTVTPSKGGSETRPNTSALKNYLPIIFLNSATAGGAWLLAGNAGTNYTTDFLGTTDNMTLTFRVSNTVAFRLGPASGTNTPNIIGGYSGNTVAPGVLGATIGGGGFGGQVNSVSANYATVSGGIANTASNPYAAVGGGYGNTAGGTNAAIGGGFSNTTSGTAATVSGGQSNTASQQFATVGGGSTNTAGNQYATVGGGYQNSASGSSSTVGGGASNTASGFYATVAGGYNNVASGDYSFAAGQHANTNGKSGALVWADKSTSTVLSSTVANQFLVRATGGIIFATNTALTTGCSIPAGGGSWNCSSDKNVKANFSAVDSRAILAKVNALPITTWNYTTQDAQIRHIGPMAQDFAAAFKVGENDTTISTVDAQGVALAAIQGLAQENQDLKAQNENLEARVSALEQANGVSSPNVINLNNLPLWGIVGLLAFLLVKRRK